MALDSAFFPEGFIKAARVVWGEKAENFLIGIQASIQLTKETSTLAAKDWLDSQGIKIVFLNEAGLKNTYRAIGHTGKLVDLVAESISGRFILVEAKSFLDAAQLRSSFFGANKFETSIKALKEFYEKGCEIFPGVEELIITARKIHISGRSSWSISEDGVLLKDKIAVLICGLPIFVRKISF